MGYLRTPNKNICGSCNLQSKTLISLNNTWVCYVESYSYKLKYNQWISLAESFRHDQRHIFKFTFCGRNSCLRDDRQRPNLVAILVGDIAQIQTNLSRVRPAWKLFVSQVFLSTLTILHRIVLFIDEDRESPISDNRLSKALGLG